jgi:RimJ/RimL family protein N-acetyltransferase
MILRAPSLETDRLRLRLREQRWSDKTAYLTMWSDPRVTHYIGGEPQAPEIVGANS